MRMVQRLKIVCVALVVTTIALATPCNAQQGSEKEIAAQKKADGDALCRHYAIMRRFKIKDAQEKEAIKTFEGVNESLQELFFEEMGINVIWVDEYSEVPEILRQIKL